MFNNPPKIAVVGAGSWGTAIVSIVSTNNKLMWWVRRESQIKQITSKKRNTRYLPNCDLKTNQIQLTNNISDVFSYADIIIIATPSEYLPSIFTKTKDSYKDKIIISAVKGVITQDNQTPKQFFESLSSSIKYGVISGPCHAEEVALQKKSYLTISVDDPLLTELLYSIFDVEFIDVKISTDIIGTELSAILKNVYALITGICNGLGYGDNFLAVLITSCANELKEVLYVLDHKDRNISQPAYLGDLLVTCYSVHSRNRRFGTYIGKGYSVEATKAVMNMVAEGYNATKCIYSLLNDSDSLGVAPILLATYNMLYKDAEPEEEIINLSKLIS
jgi:glycerol-3-phosphate dehydrogenase (NAD(P)+)